MNQPNPRSLYAPREPIFPRRVAAKFRARKWWIMGVTLAICHVTPWIHWDRGPSLPDQAVLIDMAHRRFYFFWIRIWPQEFYFVAGLLIMAGIGLFLFTSALGRVWCGYTCPQTVWTDLFILVERWIKGDRNARVRLWNAPMTARKPRGLIGNLALSDAALLVRPQIEVAVSPIRNPLFVSLSDGSIGNAYDVRLRNKWGDERQFNIELAGDPNSQVRLERADDSSVMVPADTTALHRIYVLAPANTGSAMADTTDIRFAIEEPQSAERVGADSVFHGKEAQ
ncbi:FixG Ig-like domain-containing protein [Paracoccus tegillarcae]|nr:FixG Ig-like domain-containing protein [Paracoccus tegillarcae]